MTFKSGSFPDAPLHNLPIRFPGNFVDTDGFIQAFPAPEDTNTPVFHQKN